MPAYHLHIVPPLERTPGFFRGLMVFLLNFLERFDHVECVYPSHYSLHTFQEKIDGKKISLHAMEGDRANVTFNKPDGRSLLFVTLNDRVVPFPSEMMEGPISSAPLLLVGLTPFYWEILRAKNLLAQGQVHGYPSSRSLPVLCHDAYPGGLSKAVVEETLGQTVQVIPFLAPSPRRLSDNSKDLPDVLESSMKIMIRELVDNIWDLFQVPADSSINNETKALPPDELLNRLIARLWENVRNGNGLPLANGSSQVLGERINEEISFLLRALTGWRPSPEELADLKSRALSHVVGLGPLEELMKNSDVTEIMVNGLSDVYLEKGGRVHKSEARFVNDTQLKAVIDRVVAEGGRRVDVSSPFCDVRLKDGSRANVILPPLSMQGPVLTIRRFKSNFFKFHDLIECKTLTEAHAAYLTEAVSRRMNIVVAGNTGSGKTTLLNILSTCIADEERILTLEDTSELNIKKPHVIRLQTRPANAEGKGEIRMADLVTNALRMRPDRLIVGECRGPEAIPMLQAMNTGHDGSMTTLHSNSAADAVRRLESMVLLGAPEWPIQVVREQIYTALDVIVYLRREGPRRILVELVSLREEKGVFHLTPAGEIK